MTTTTATRPPASPVLRSICSPVREQQQQQRGSPSSSSCLTLQELRTLVHLYNKQHRARPIRIPDKHAENEAYYRARLRKRLHKACRVPPSAAIKGLDEFCWTQQPFARDAPQIAQVQTSAFRPEKPKSWYSKPNEWLTSMDILYVMRQYEQAYPHFKFLGVVPIDFAADDGTGQCISRPMCAFDADEMQQRGHTMFATVFNLDRHDQPGSHWVACFGCIDPQNACKYGIGYFDSGGLAPPAPIVNFMRVVRDQLTRRAPAGAPPCHIKYNPKRRQFGNTECGIFCLAFIILHLQMKKGTYRDVRLRIGSDKDMTKLRDVLFSPHTDYLHRHVHL
jgi:hypothetical protein